MFDRYPETKSKFKRLTTTTPEEMRASARVRAHAGRVVTALGGIISSLEDNEMIDETIYLLGDSHKKRGIAGEDFEVSDGSKRMSHDVSLVALGEKHRRSKARGNEAKGPIASPWALEKQLGENASVFFLSKIVPFFK